MVLFCGVIFVFMVVQLCHDFTLPGINSVLSNALAPLAQPRKICVNILNQSLTNSQYKQNTLHYGHVK